MSYEAVVIQEGMRQEANRQLCDAFQEYLERNDTWRGSSRSIANELRDFLKKPFILDQKP